MASSSTPPPIKIAPLQERLRASAAVPLPEKLRALSLQAGQPTAPDPIAAAVAFRKFMQKPSS